MPTGVMAHPRLINASPFCLVWREKVTKEVGSVLHDSDQSACSHSMSAGQGVTASHLCGLGLFSLLHYDPCPLQIVFYSSSYSQYESLQLPSWGFRACTVYGPPWGFLFVILWAKRRKKPHCVGGLETSILEFRKATVAGANPCSSGNIWTRIADEMYSPSEQCLMLLWLWQRLW